MPMRTMSCGQSETDKTIASRASAPEPMQRSPTDPQAGQWEAGKGPLARCRSEVLPRPPSSSRVLTAFLDEMTQDMEGMEAVVGIRLPTEPRADPIMNMLGDELPGEGMGAEADDVATPVFVTPMEPCAEAGRDLPPLPVSMALPAELAGKASGVNLAMSDLPHLP